MFYATMDVEAGNPAYSLNSPLLENHYETLYAHTGGSLDHLSSNHVRTEHGGVPKGKIHRNRRIYASDGSHLSLFSRDAVGGGL